MSRALLLLACLLLAGCLAPGRSEASRIWELPRPEGTGPSVKVFLPAELRTPRVVADDTQGPHVIRDFDRWGTPLHEALARLISGHLRIEPSVRSAVVEFRVLRVDTSASMEIAADYQVAIRTSSGEPDLVRQGKIALNQKGDKDAGLETAVATYAAVAQAVTDAIRSELAEAANGEVAKPAAPVSVPAR